MNGAAAEPFLLDAVAAASFRANTAIDTLGQRLKDKLGLATHNVPARLAIARSLAMSSQPPSERGSGGRIIRGDILFGSGVDLACWVSLLAEHAGRELPLREFQTLVQKHWIRGMRVLDAELAEGRGGSVDLWRQLTATLRSSDIE